MQDYYEPRLLPRILNPRNGKLEDEFSTVRSLQDLNRAEPAVEIEAIDYSSEPGWAKVKVRVTPASYATTSGRKWKTVAYDLRLFRNGRLVGQCPEPDDGRGPFGRGAATPIDDWRAATRVTKTNDLRVEQASESSLRVRFRVKVPRLDAAKPTFTAYAFNEDRVRSAVAVFGHNARERDE